MIQNYGKAEDSVFRDKICENIFETKKYKQPGGETWVKLTNALIDRVAGKHMTSDEIKRLKIYMGSMKVMPGGRYLYYACRKAAFFNNCYLLGPESDSREDWGDMLKKSTSCTTTGGGIGAPYSMYRAEGTKINRIGGKASGPIALMQMVNDNGRRVMSGGSRRVAIWAGLHHWHSDVNKFLTVKDWDRIPVAGTNFTVGQLKKINFDYPAPLDCTNISVIYDNKWLNKYNESKAIGDVFRENCRLAMKNGEPGFSFNFGKQEKEDKRNACTEVTSEDDSDVCNLGSINLSRIENLEELKEAVELMTKFLICGTLEAELPYEKCYQVRAKNRRLGLGLMGVHEWLLARGYKYDVVPEMHKWLEVYRDVSDSTAIDFCDRLNISVPVAKRAIAPTGSIGMLAGTTTGIEPIYSVAYKRRYLRGNEWHYEYVVDGTAQILIDRGIDPEKIESAHDLAIDYKRRIKFQYDIQKYVDMAISSTINLPSWGSVHNNEKKVGEFANTLAEYAHGLRGITFYPDGARGGQPITAVPYSEASKKTGQVYKEQFHDVCELSGKGTCEL